MSADVVYIEAITKSEAISLTTAIKTHVDEIVRHESLALPALARMWKAEGWRSMGYKSFNDWATHEFTQSAKHVYRLKDVALVDEAVRQINGGTPLPLKEITIRQLKQFDVETKAEIVKNAFELASAQGKAQPQAPEYAHAIAQHEARQHASRYAPIGTMVRMGDITAEQGAQLSQAVDKLNPVLRGVMVSFIYTTKLRDANLIAPIAEMVERDNEKPSRILEEMKTLGTLAGTPLSEATLTDLQLARQNASREYREEAIQKRVERGQSVPVDVVLDKSNAVYSAKAIFHALGKDTAYAVMVKLAELLAESDE